MLEKRDTQEKVELDLDILSDVQGGVIYTSANSSFVKLQSKDPYILARTQWWLNTQ